MAATPCDNNQMEDKEEYILVDFDSLAGVAHIPPNAPYVLSGLDTLNPILIIDNKLKLIGEYDETIGTCFVFSEKETAPVSNEDAGPSKTAKDVKPIASLHKILKFKLLSEDGTYKTDC